MANFCHQVVTGLTLNLRRLDTTSAILLDATQKIHDRYNSGPKKEVIALGEEFEKVRLTYS